MRRNINGFTIVELLTIIVVITILTSIAIVSYTRYQADAEASRVKATADIVVNGLERYYKDNGEYPTPRDLAGTSNLFSSTPVESDYTTAATILRTSASSLFDKTARFSPCVSGTSGNFTCSSTDASATAYNRIFYFSKLTQTTAASQFNLTRVGCDMSFGPSSANGVLEYIVAYYDKKNSKWIFKKSMNGTSTIAGGANCAFTT